MAVKTVVVVGRGIAGLAAAYELAKAGFPVTVVGPRREDEPPGAGSRAATGISALKGAILPKKELFAAKAEGHELLPSWLAEVERAAGEAIPRRFAGVSELFFDLTGYAGIRARVFHRKFTGAYRAEVLGIKELNARAGDLSQFGLTARGGFFYPRDGWFDPSAALAALEGALRVRGVAIVDDVVHSVREHPDNGLIIHTKSRSLEADEAVLAAGVWTDGVLAASGVERWPGQQVFGGETLLGASAGGELIVTFQKTSLVSYGGKIRFGSTCYPSTVASGPDFERVAELKRKLSAYAPLPAFSDVLFGLRARAPDRLPTFGPLFFPSRNRRLWLLTGLYKNGLQLAPLFARQLPHFLASSSAYGPFLPSRF